MLRIFSWGYAYKRFCLSILLKVTFQPHTVGLNQPIVSKSTPQVGFMIHQSLANKGTK